MMMMRMRYLIVRPEKVDIVNLFRFLFRLDSHDDHNDDDGCTSTNNSTSAAAAGINNYNHGFIETNYYSYSDDDDDDMINHKQVLENNDDDDDDDDEEQQRWVIMVSIIVRKIVGVLGKPMELFGFMVEFLLNLLSLNGGSIFSLFSNFVTGKVVRPQRNSQTFISAIGHLDGRIDLYKQPRNLPQAGDHDEHEHDDDDDDGVIVAKNYIDPLGDRNLMDLCIMASKLAYENAKLVQNIVLHHWKMHFVEFFNGWNDFQKEKSTQVFILCDKPVDANLILISFRGTEPFDADDWSTDFDYSWYEIPKLGKVHMGFLEALGLGNRDEVSTFFHHLQAGGRGRYNNVKQFVYHSDDNWKTSLNDDDDDEPSSVTGKKKLLPEMVDMTAYYGVRSKLKELLNEHKNAKFIVTGHSLGGALAILFPTVLLLNEENEMMKRLLVVYTFGQPRVGDRKLGRYMEYHLNHPIPRYFRVVYCNDLVPRLPYDNKTFLFKHFGSCLYYNSLYIEQEVEEEPNRNFFGMKYLIPEHLNAIWELIRSLTMGYTHGPEYKEGWFSILARVMGLALPGISAHCPTDYVNSVRLGKMLSFSLPPSFSSSI